MPKVIQTTEFQRKIGKHSKSLQKDKDYIVVANEKKPDQSMVIMNINVAIAFFSESKFKEIAFILQSTLKEITRKVSERYSELGSRRGK